MSEAADLTQWVGRKTTAAFSLDAWPAAALTAALGRDDPPVEGAALPPFWHHLYGLPIVTAQATGPDGHGARGGFLPPVPLPRRMWAGGRLRVARPLLIGQTVERISEVRAITPKEGRHGPLVFVLVEHALHDAEGAAVIEEHDIVYRGLAPAGPPEGTSPPPATPGVWQQRWQPDEVLLFRYSALTYNGHRIHYDHRYVTEVEGYPGLIVHGPLLATLMLDLVRRRAPKAAVRHFAFRAVAPLFAGDELTAHGTPTADGAGLWITGAGDRLAMQGDVRFD